MIELPMTLNPDPMRIRPKVRMPSNAFIRTNIKQLCKQAGISSRSTALPRVVIVHRGRCQTRTRAMDVVGIPSSIRSLRSTEAALRALEMLAVSFLDHNAKHCVLNRGFFYAPKVRGNGRHARIVPGKRHGE
jgi:hypothetical protein